MLTPVAPRPEPAIRNLHTDSMQTAMLIEHDALETELAKVSYFSPVTRIDVETQRAVLQYRNAETGQLIRQYPSEKQIQAYQRAASQVGRDDAGSGQEGNEESHDRAGDEGAGPEKMGRTRWLV